MAKLLSGRQRFLNVGVSSSTESLTTLNVVGNSFISGITTTNSIRVSAGATINGITYPTSDGTNLQVLSTDGAGVLSFQSVSSLSGLDWNADTDFGSITDSVTLSSDSGLIISSVSTSYDLGLIYLAGLIYPSQFVLPSFTVSTLPTANPAGQMLFVTDETGGSIPAFSDGTNWRRVTDAQIVS
jgi:hypothetical protein